jgi:hypothetical protein
MLFRWTHLSMLTVLCSMSFMLHIYFALQSFWYISVQGQNCWFGVSTVSTTLNGIYPVEVSYWNCIRNFTFESDRTHKHMSKLYQILNFQIFLILKSEDLCFVSSDSFKDVLCKLTVHLHMCNICDVSWCNISNCTFLYLVCHACLKHSFFV